MAKESTSSDFDFVDDFYFAALFDEETDDGPQEIFQVSDSKYAEKLQFQEALMGSVIISQKNNTNPSISSSSPSLLLIEPAPVLLNRCSGQDQPIPMEMIAKEAGESSLSFCEICAERKESDQMFSIDSCVHSFCSDCITKHVATKIQDSITIVTCPGLNCGAVLELDTCRPVLSKGVIDLWEEALCEELIGLSQRFYCPYKDCSALLVNDNEGEAIRESECPFCHRLFCAQCYVPWHSGVDCEEFQRLNEDERGRDDIMVKEIARDNKWSRCPNCKFYVERTEGCPHMTCRCKFQFCYGCGGQWTQTHGGCQSN